jgi:hypothetical protein
MNERFTCPCCGAKEPTPAERSGYVIVAPLGFVWTSELFGKKDFAEQAIRRAWRGDIPAGYRVVHGYSTTRARMPLFEEKG